MTFKGSIVALYPYDSHLPGFKKTRNNVCTVGKRSSLMGHRQTSTRILFIIIISQNLQQSVLAATSNLRSTFFPHYKSHLSDHSISIGGWSLILGKKSFSAIVGCFLISGPKYVE